MTFYEFINNDDIVKSLDASLRFIPRLVTATYVQVRLIPQDSRASPADLFTIPSQMGHFLTFYDVVNNRRRLGLFVNRCRSTVE